MVTYQLALDKDGNVYATGWLYAEVTVKGVAVSFDGGSSDVFVAKFTPEGNLLWMMSDGAEPLEESYGITVDAEGNVYLTGSIENGAKLAGNDLEASGAFSMLVAKYDSNGEPLWARAGGSSGADAGEAVVVDDEGNVYVTGQLGDPDGTFGHIEVNGGVKACFLVKYSPEGEVMWAQSSRVRRQ